MPLPVLEDGLLDPAGRRMEYLRLSITDACNFRCVYCLPQGWAGPSFQVAGAASTEATPRGNGGAARRHGHESLRIQ